MSQAEQDELSKLTLEDVLCGSGYADIPASPLQRAICRVAQGRPLEELACDPDVIAAFGGATALESLPSQRPAVLEIVAGVRAGKSMIAACAAVCAALTSDQRHLKLHEVARFPTLAPTVDAADATLTHQRGIIEHSPLLSRYLDDEPTSDTITLRRPDGRRVELVVVAAKRGGLSVRNRWLCGFVLEELAQFGAEETGAVVNAEEILRAAETRLLPGCTGWLISSPYGPQGLLHELWKRYFGRPGRTVVVHASTRQLNPSFPQAQIDAVRADNPDVASREHDAGWLDADSAFLPATIVDPAIRKELWRTGTATAAGMDTATRGNSWTLAVAWSEHGPDGAQQRIIIGGVWSWTGSKSAPLSPRDTLIEIARVLAPYRITRIHVDSWSFDAMADHARAAGLELIEHPAGDRDLPYQRLRVLLGNGDLELPPDPVMRSDLLAMRQRANSAGVKIHLPRTANGRHCDYAPSVALAAMHAENHVGRLVMHTPTSIGSIRPGPITRTRPGAMWGPRRGDRDRSPSGVIRRRMN